MICYSTRWLQNILPRFRSIKRKDHCLHSIEKRNQIREFSSAFPDSYSAMTVNFKPRPDPTSDAKYAEIRKRLAAVPYLKMLEKEEDRFRHVLCYQKDERLSEVQMWFSKVFDHNARISQNVSSAALLKAYCTYGFSMDDSTWDHWDSDKWRTAVILAWCVELLQACHILADDIVDSAALRKGKPCWYTKPDVGMRAIIDALFLLSAIHKVLDKQFAGTKMFMDILQEFFQTNHSAVCGQVLDTMYNPQNRKSRMDTFTFEKYQTLAEYKTNSLGFCLPLHLAMHLAGERSAKEFEFIREFSFKLAMYFQIQDDYLDCFEKPEITGETTTDIPEGRLTFWAVKFLEVASKPMKEEFLENYGVTDTDAISTVLELYRKTNLIEIYREFEAKLSAEINLLIESKNDIKGAFFHDLFDQIQKRNFN